MNNKSLIVAIVAGCLGAASCSRENEAKPEDGRASAPFAAAVAPVESVAPARPAKPHVARKRPPLRPRKPAAQAAVRQPKSTRKPVVATEDRTDLTPSDKKTLLAIEKALEDEDLKAARAIAKDALRASSPEVRSECIDMLGWFDEKALAELTPFLSDPDRDVAENALSTWTRALGQIEDEKLRCESVGGVMKALKDPDALETLVMEVNDCDETLRMQMLVDLIGGENEAAAKTAREHYEFMTGDEFTTVEAAEKWLRENKAEEEN